MRIPVKNAFQNKKKYDFVLYFSLHISQSSSITLLLLCPHVIISSSNFNIGTLITARVIDGNCFHGFNILTEVDEE